MLTRRADIFTGSWSMSRKDFRRCLWESGRGLVERRLGSMKICEYWGFCVLGQGLGEQVLKGAFWLLCQ